MFEFIFEFTFSTQGFQSRINLIPRIMEGIKGETRKPAFINTRNEEISFEKGKYDFQFVDFF